MNISMNKKIVLVIVSLFLGGIIGYLFFMYSAKSTGEEESVDTTAPPVVEKTAPTEEIPVSEEDVVEQPAYLIAAYSTDGKNYIDVDYVEWLHGQDSLNAQVQDGECISITECYDYPNGYKRNQNPKIRTLELSSSASLVVNGDLANALGKSNSANTVITFETLEDALAHTSSFQKTKAFVTIDVSNNMVTKLVEPYQE